MAEPRRLFWPVVLVGAGSAALAAVATGRPWASASGQAVGTAEDLTKGSEAAPLTLALVLVALAAWGAFLVVRLRARRLVALVGSLAALGASVAAGRGLGDARRAALAVPGAEPTAQVSGWFAVAVGGGAVAGVAFLVALVLAKHWPEMSTKYDAPGEREQDQTDLWKALDHGDDPTL